MERNFSIDFVKFFAIFAVVCIHTGTISELKLGAINGDDADFVIDTFGRFAVPFFFVASGYLFIQKINTLKEPKQQLSYFKKYTLKLTKLWAAWFLFYFMYDLIINYIETEKTVQALKEMFLDYLGSYYTWETLYYGAFHTQYHLWFLLALIWSIVILFTFTKLRLTGVLFIIALGLNLYGLFGQSYSTFVEVTLNTRDALFFGLFYTTLGGVIGKYANKVKTIAMKIPSYIYIGLIIILPVIQVTEGFITLKLLGGSAGNYYLATIPFIIILFMATLKYNKLGKGSILSKIGANAVGIYVSHVFVMEATRLFINRLDLTFVQDTILWKLAFTPLVFITAYFLYIGLQYMKKSINKTWRSRLNRQIQEDDRYNNRHKRPNLPI